VNTMEFWLAGIVAVLLLIYLIYCLFKAEEL
jgi:K+-transporting ATPase KdpF subunit